MFSNFWLSKPWIRIRNRIHVFQFLVIKTMEPDPEPDPDSLEMLDPDSQHSAPAYKSYSRAVIHF
jgi:hypothetical protein